MTILFEQLAILIPNRPNDKNAVANDPNPLCVTVQKETYDRSGGSATFQSDVLKTESPTAW